LRQTADGLSHAQLFTTGRENDLVKPWREPIRVLTQDECRKIHDAALTILDHVGMRIEHAEACGLLAAHGCRVNQPERIVRFPRNVVEDAVARMRAAFADPERLPEGMAVRYGRVLFHTEPLHVHQDFTVNAGGFCTVIYDLDGVRRKATVADTRASLRLADGLDEIAHTGLPVSAQEIPESLRPVAMAAELAKHTRKFGGIEAFRSSDVPYLKRIGEIVQTAEERERWPALVPYAEARTPLCLDENMADIYIACIREGLPQSLDTMPSAGATAPITPAGCLAMGLAETLGGLTLGYAVDQNAVLTIDFTPSYADMRTLLYDYAGGPRMPLLCARVQIVSEFYGCPSAIHGAKTDACAPGTRVGMEKMASMILPVLAGALGIGTAGHLENARTFSPQQLVIDNLIAKIVRRIVRGIEVNDEPLALDVIGDVGPGGHFLDQTHPLERARDEHILMPPLVAWPWETGCLAENQFETWAHAEAKHLMEEPHESPLTKEQTRAVDAVVEEAAETYGCTDALAILTL